jgi:mannose-6-phosphate isomerase-like protein (cupin superfamily)
MSPNEREGEMADVTVKRIEEMDSLGEGRFRRCRAELGVSSFGFQVFDMPANYEDHPEHAHANMPPPLEQANDGQEEVYVALKGSAVLLADGEEFTIEPGLMARVGPSQMRKLVTREQPAQVLVIGGIPGEPYAAPAFTEIGAAPASASTA